MMGRQYSLENTVPSQKYSMSHDVGKRITTVYYFSLSLSVYDNTKIQNSSITCKTKGSAKALRIQVVRVYIPRCAGEGTRYNRRGMQTLNTGLKCRAMVQG